MRAVLLVQKPIVQAINRRFVFTFYDAFRQRNSKAAKFYKKHGGKSYGALFTPAGKHLGSFGFDMPQIYAAMLKTKEQAPEVWALRDDEKKVLAAAKASPMDLQRQIDAARLHAELLELEKGTALLEQFVNVAKSRREKMLAMYWHAHIALAGNDLRYHSYRSKKTAKLTKQRDEIAEWFHATGSFVPNDLQDDLITDLIRLQLELRQGPGFYTGWQFAKDADHTQLRKDIEATMLAHPTSNRIGELHFYLGLVLRAQKNAKAADRVFQRHAQVYPDDRYAMASRFHHSSYQFSPYGGGRGRMVVSRQKKSPVEDVDAYLARVRKGAPQPQDPKAALTAFLTGLR